MRVSERERGKVNFTYGNNNNIASQWVYRWKDSSTIFFSQQVTSCVCNASYTRTNRSGGVKLADHDSSSLSLFTLMQRCFTFLYCDFCLLITCLNSFIMDILLFHLSSIPSLTFGAKWSILLHFSKKWNYWFGHTCSKDVRWCLTIKMISNC